jgi:hypothetical protein
MMGGNADTHYFSRNRTRGSVFPPCSSLAWEVPTIVACCFRAHFWQQGGPALRDRRSTISREAAMFCYPSACVTGEPPARLIC